MQISIHAPRTGSDGRVCRSGWACPSISIHAPRTGSDARTCGSTRRHTSFQSTLPAREATVSMTECILSANISIHAPRTGSDVDDNANLCTPYGISIHAPRTGSDASLSGKVVVNALFQSTLPARGATLSGLTAWRGTHISIHAPRTGSDVCFSLSISSTLISIHAPRTGSDDFANIERKIDNVFQSTLPARGATRFIPSASTRRRFQSTLPARGATRGSVT